MIREEMLDPMGANETALLIEGIVRGLSPVPTCSTEYRPLYVRATKSSKALPYPSP